MLSLDYDVERDYFVDLYLNSKKEVPDHYLGSLTACDNPLCDCHSMCLDLHNANKSSEEYSVWLNINKRNISGNANECADTTAFSEQLIQQLTEEDWNELFLFYRRYKATISEDIEDIDSLEADFKNHSPGNLAIYKDILPLSTPIAISGDGPPYIVGHDQYCPTPKCDCNSATLTVALLDKDSVYLTEKNSVAVTVNFKKRKLESINKRCTNKNVPSPEEVMTLINKQGDEIWRSLETRYNNIRTLYRNYLKRSRMNESNVIALSPKTKVKRNEPCPCGSGNKYKKCCL